MDRWVECRAGIVRIGASLLLSGCYYGVPASLPDTGIGSASNGDGTSTGSASTTASATTRNSDPDPDTGEPDTDDPDSDASTTSDDDTTVGTLPESESSDGTTTEVEGCTPMVAGTTTETVVVDGLDRTYVAVVPSSLEGVTAATQVIIGFHGSNGTAEHVNEAYGITSEDPVIFVYPQALYSAEVDAVAWDIAQDGIDFAFFDALLADVAEKFCVDPARIFAAGQSSGAFFVNELGCRRPDVLNAIAPVAGGGPSWYPDCTSTKSVMVVHGVNDETVPFEQGQNARDFWREINECPDGLTTPTEPPPCGEYMGCDEPVLWCPHNGDHEWPDFAGPAIRTFFLMQ